MRELLSSDDSVRRAERYIESTKRYWPWLGLLTALIAFTTLVISRLDHLAWSDDEAVFVLTAQAVRQGNALYSAVWFNYLPGFLQLLNVAFMVGGYSLGTARIAVLCCALLALALVAALGRTVSTSWGGVLSLLLLAASPHFLALSGAVMTEVPAAGLATGAVWAVLAYHRTRRRQLLALGGLLLAASLWVKPTMIGTGLVLLLAVWVTEDTLQRRLGAAVLLVTVIALSLCVGLLFCHPVDFLHQFVITYVRSKSAFEFELSKNAGSLLRYFFRDKYQVSHASLLLLWAYGWYTLRRRRPTEAKLLGSWPIAVIAVLIFHTPLYRHHLVQLLFPVVILAGAGLTGAIAALRSHRGRARLAVIFGLLALTAIELALSLRVDLFTLPTFESDNAEMADEAARFIRETTDPHEYLVTDGHIIALEAGRPVPPGLTNTSRMRIRTGQLTGQDLIDAVRHTQPGGIVFWERKLDSLEDFTTWVDCHYDETRYFSERHRIYQPGPSILQEGTPITLDVSFGADIRLLSYIVSPESMGTGDRIELALNWRAMGRPEGDLRVFVHLVDSQGAILGQDDGPPRQGRCPTWVWQPGETITDVRSVTVNEVGAGSPYRLLVGLYDEYGSRILTSDGQGNRLPHDRVSLSLHAAALEPASYQPIPQHRQEVNLGDQVKLMGYDLVNDSVQLEEALAFTLYWQCLDRMTTSYTVFTHLVDESGEIRAQEDRVPGGGEYPTLGWAPGEVITDHYMVPIRKGAQPGGYVIEVGIYSAGTGQRVPVLDEAGQETGSDRILLGTSVQVGRP